MFRANWDAAKAAGVPRGAYHFVFWCRPAHEQAQWFIQHIPNDPDALPPVLDLEWNTHSRTCPRKVDRETALEKARLMLRELERHTGKRPIIYTDITFHREVLEGMSEFDRYPFWLRSVALSRMSATMPAAGPSGSSRQRAACPASAAMLIAMPSMAASGTGRSFSPQIAIRATAITMMCMCAAGHNAAPGICPRDAAHRAWPAARPDAEA